MDTMASPEGHTETFSGLLDEIAIVQAQISRLQARESRLYAACADYALARAEAETPNSSESEIIWRSTAFEVGATLHISDRAASARMNAALTLAADFPAVRQAWSCGVISTSHVTAIVREGTLIASAEARTHFTDRILDIAVDETPARTASIARVMASRAEPEVVAARQERAVCERSVRVTDVEDGMSILTAVLPTTLAQGIFDRLTQAAKLTAQADRRALARVRAESGDDTPLPRLRRTDEIRADLLADLLLTGAPSLPPLPEGPAVTGDTIDATIDGASGVDLSALRGHVQIIVTAEALYGESDDAAVTGAGSAIPLAHARAIAAQTPTWDRVTIDPVLNTILAVDTYRPSEGQRRLLTALDGHCRTPGCLTAATRCDVDHSHDYARGGRTEIVNLADLCEPHHVMKHGDEWVITRAPDGALIWTSRHGRSYPDVARPAVAFMFSDTRAPF